LNCRASDSSIEGGRQAFIIYPLIEESEALQFKAAVAEYDEFGDFGIWVVMCYKVDTLAQQFTVDVLYGVGVLRNEFGLQVMS